MRYFYKKKKKKYYKKSLTSELVKKLKPSMIICFIIFLLLVIYSGFDRRAIIILSIILALIPNVLSLFESYNKRKRYLNMDLSEIDNLTGYEFEQLLSTYYKKIGYKVEDTPKSNDYGADLILSKNGTRYVLQAKRYKSKVGVKAIQEVVASKAHYKAEGAIVATNNYFTQNAWKLARENKVFLIDRAKLASLKEEVESKEK